MTRLPLTDLLDIAAFADPAAGRRFQVLKRTRARSAIAVVGQDLLRRVFVLKAWADRCATEQFVAEILRTQQQFNPKWFGIEANAMQVLFGDSVVAAAKVAKIPFPMTPVYQPTNVEKDWRIRTTLQPVIAQGRLLVQASQLDLWSELRTFPNTPTKDVVDALASAVALLPVRTLAESRNTERDAFAAYLRDAGVPASQILTRVRNEYGVGS